MDSKYCSSCGSQIKKEAEICPECGVRQKPAKKEKSSGLAVFLSLVMPGLGQIYNGQILKGFGVFLSEAFLLAFVLLLLFGGANATAFLIIILLISIYLYSLYDAHSIARKINLS
ncbi:zinc ribbon domain-containing protein [Halorubrum sp. SD626R]|uniref:zinc ribbon domain-containing protein n=1 Tax=Halorubrum sp. SD626R TaxID=1419722 RepID=UPI001305480E|nr:zinc ribbon domain-containing protein [Halorubrum sp. SD626R]